MGRRFVSGALGAGASLGMLALSMYVVNVAVRSYAVHRLATQPQNITAEALIAGF